MPKIFDNIHQKLLPDLRDKINPAYRVDFYIGYFNLHGWRQLAVVSPFPASVKRATKATAFRRNVVAAHLADYVLVTHAERGSQTWALAEMVLGWGKRVLTFDHPKNKGLLGLGCGVVLPPSISPNI